MRRFHIICSYKSFGSCGNLHKTPKNSLKHYKTMINVISLKIKIFLEKNCFCFSKYFFVFQSKTSDQLISMIWDNLLCNYVMFCKHLCSNVIPKWLF